MKKTSRVIPAHYEWVGNKLFWREKYTLKTYSCKVKLSWKKVADAYGYVVCTTKLKPGDYVNKVGNGYSHTVTKKTSYTYSAQPIEKKTKKLQLYIAPLSKDGYIGQVQKITVKIKK